MLHLARTLLLALLIGSLCGCATRESLRQNFRAERDACVGQRMGDRGWWWCGWDESTRTVELDQDYDEYQITSTRMPGCRWAYVVDRRLQIVRSWRYLSDPAPCYVPVDWLGAW